MEQGDNPVVDPHITNIEVGRRAAAMLTDLRGFLTARLATETDNEERLYLQSLYDLVPSASLLLGIAVAAQNPDAAIRKGK